MPFITLASPTDTVVLMGDDPYATGYTYRNDTLTSWYGFAGADAPKDKRPNAHGSFGYDRLYANEGTITIKGSFWGASPLEAAVARNRLTGLFADGLPVTMTVSDELGISSRQLNIVEAEVPYLPYPNFDFELTATVPDPRRYGPSAIQTTGAPTPSTGLVWPLGSNGKTETDVKFIGTGPNEATVMTVTAPAGTPVAISLSVSVSMLQNSVLKSGTLRLRDGVGGAELVPSYTLADKGDSAGGNTDTWTLSATVTSASGTLVVTGQTNSGTQLYSARRSLNFPTAYWNWGTPGTSGQLVFTNTGNVSTSPSFRAYGAALSSGFRIVEIETARELTYGMATAQPDVVYLNGKYRTVTINGGGNYLQRLTKRQWFNVPPRTTRTYQFTPLGGYTGTPQLDIIAAAANL